jgi:hypothetical protein
MYVCYALALVLAAILRSRVIGDSFPEFGHIDSWKFFLGMDLLAYDLDVCAAGESSVPYTIYVCVVVHLGH